MLELHPTFGYTMLCVVLNAIDMNEINKLIKDKPKLTERISAGLDRELKRQKKAGKKFISDEEVDTLIDGVIKEELGDAWKEHYT